MNGNKGGLNEAIVVGCVFALAAAIPIGAVWMVSLWAEDRFGETGSIAMGVLGIIIVVVVVVLAIGMFFARIYRAGTVDATRLQQIAQQGDVAQVREVTRLLRPEVSQAARTTGMYERDVLNMANKKAALMVRDQQQLPGPVSDAATIDADAEWYELRAAHGITYDE